MNVRILTPEDVENLYALRLRSVKEHPEAFGTAYEEEVKRGLNVWRERLNEQPDSVIFGAFHSDELSGMVGLRRVQRVKTGHRAVVWGMYTAPEVRGKGVGRLLLDALIDYAKTLPDLTDLLLSVTVGNDAARQLYLKTGFTPYGVEPRYIKLGDAYYDAELMHRQL